MKYRYFLCLFGLMLLSILTKGQSRPSSTGKWSEAMAQSVMKRNPSAWMIDFMDRPVWSYPQGLVLLSFEKLYLVSGKKEYYDYIKSYADELIDEQGTILTYKYETYNIDMINSGKLLFHLYAETKDPRYLTALNTLRKQLKFQPKTSEGGFWHKLRYTHQMWLDGAYMGTPFLLQYAEVFGDNTAREQGIHQLVLMEKYLRDPHTGLLYHGWDESKFQQWADPKTGRSPNVWGRAMGWYAMALVDALDYIPEDHYGQVQLRGILERLAQAIIRYQDPKSKLWYQVIDRPGEQGNYLEASASCMFVYALAKGVNKGYLKPSALTAAQEGYQGIIDQLIREEAGEIHLDQVCAVAGLGGDPYRDGTYEYYINEKIKTNDPKGIGPFILASLEMEKAGMSGD